MTFRVLGSVAVNSRITRRPNGHPFFTLALPALLHDGRFATLADVVEHYDSFLKLRSSEPENKDLVEYLKSL